MAMEIDFSPEPSPEQRQALLEGLERLLRDHGPQLMPPAYRSAWREAGIREAVSTQASDVRPRSSFGAMRA